MCSVSGIFNYLYGNKISEDQLLKFNQILKHRGPDGSGIWVSKDKKIGLAHNRLSIIELSKQSNQPMFIDDNLIIIFNGEIYNFIELRNNLIKKGYKFKTKSDTEVVARMFLHYGHEYVKFLRGMYAIAIWDRKKNNLILSRDTFGIKPLYYKDKDGVLIFSSEIKLFSEINKSEKKDISTDEDFLYHGYILGPKTIYENVKEVEPGSSILISYNKNLKIINNDGVDKYFSEIDESLFYKKNNNINDYEEMYDAIQESVILHTRSDVEVASFLSQGYDSNLIRKILINNKINSKFINLSFDDNDLKNNEKIKNQENLINYNFNREDLISMNTEIHRYMDQPSIDGFNTFYASSCVKKEGIKVVLSGVGADEIFSGYTTINKINLISFFYKNLRILNKIDFLQNFKTYKLFTETDDFEQKYILSRSINSKKNIFKYLKKKINIKNKFVKKPDNYDNWSEKFKLKYLEITYYMKNQLLRDSDWASMANGIELRTPFVDKFLLKKLLKIPLFYRQNKKEIFQRYLNNEKYIIKKNKTGFNYPRYSSINPYKKINYSKHSFQILESFKK
tara:strand:+ start:2146 stop:3840 length:1695 start_codon:yes stop_codon:yes gene_type:complete